MAGRHHLPAQTPVNPQIHARTNPSATAEARLTHRLAVAPSSSSSSSSSAGLEDRAAVQHREIQTLLYDNQRLATTHVALKQELAAAQQDLRALAAAAAAAKADGDARVREVFERSLKAEAEARLFDGATAELDRVRGDAGTLGVSLEELKGEMKEVEGKLARARGGLKQVADVKSEIDSVRWQIQRGRAAIEKEKKTRAYNLEFRTAMEEKMVSMAGEIDKLHAELANAEMRARVAAAAANPNPLYGGGQLYPKPYNLHQVQSGDGSNAPYGSGPVFSRNKRTCTDEDFQQAYRQSSPENVETTAKLTVHVCLSHVSLAELYSSLKIFIF